MIIFTDTLGWVAAVLTVLLGLPQLITTIKTKQTSGVNYISMFVFGLGLLMWTCFSAVIGREAGLKVGVANILALTTFTALLIALLKFSNNKNWMAISAGLMLILIGAYIFFILGQANQWKINKTQNFHAGEFIFSACGGLLTTFAFFPQIIKTFKTKDTNGLSLGLFILGMSVNITWAIFWGLQGEPRIGAPLTVWVMPCVLSVVGTFIYGSQIALILLSKKNKKITEQKEV